MTAPSRAGEWTDDDLDAWRAVADEPADRAVAAYFEAMSDAEPGTLLGSLVAHTRVPTEDQIPEIAEFLESAATLPSWADPDRVARGQRYFTETALHQFTALYLASLPSAYAAAKGVHVLWLTARLRDDPERRLNETAQFLMDVTTPDGFVPGGTALERVVHVRLMHAGVRWLIDHDEHVAHPDDADPAHSIDRPTWAASWGRPANQEDLAGTMLTFSTVVFDALERSGVSITAADREDYFHLWRVIGSLLGIDDELLPDDVGEAQALQRAIFGRQQTRSAAGEDLMAVLLGLARARVPRPLAALAPAMIRRYVGDDVADMLAIPRGGAGKLVFTILVGINRLMSFGRRFNPIPRSISNRVGRELLNGLLAADRGGDRVPFDIPDHLADLR